MKSRLLTLLISCGLFAYSLGAQTIVVPAQSFTATGQTGASIQLLGTATLSSATLSINGTFTTVTFAVQASNDGGTTWFPITTASVATPSTYAATQTATAAGMYVLSVAGFTNLRIVTSSTFTASSAVTFSLTGTSAPYASRSSGGGATLPFSGPVCATSATGGTVCTGAQVSALVTGAITPSTVTVSGVSILKSVLPTGILISALPGSGNTTYQQYWVTDATSLVDCTVGSSSTAHACQWDGGVWKSALPVYPVALGGTGLATLTTHAVQIGEGTSSPNQMAVCGTGVPVVGVTGADPICSASGALGTNAFSSTTIPAAQVAANLASSGATGVTGVLPHANIASTAVTPGSYTRANITVAADGSVTAAANGSGGGGYPYQMCGWQAGSINLMGTNAFGFFGGSPYPTSNPLVQEVPMAVSGTVTSLAVTQAVANPSGQTVAYTVTKNNSAQTVTCTVPASGGTPSPCTDTSHSFTFAAGDLLVMSTSGSATAASSAVGFCIGVTN